VESTLSNVCFTDGTGSTKVQCCKFLILIVSHIEDNVESHSFPFSIVNRYYHYVQRRELHDCGFSRNHYHHLWYFYSNYPYQLVLTLTTLVPMTISSFRSRKADFSMYRFLLNLLFPAITHFLLVPPVTLCMPKASLIICAMSMMRDLLNMIIHISTHTTPLCPLLPALVLRLPPPTW
jgi:hypothetical protein